MRVFSRRLLQPWFEWWNPRALKVDKSLLPGRGKVEPLIRLESHLLLGRSLLPRAPARCCPCQPWTEDTTSGSRWICSGRSNQSGREYRPRVDLVSRCWSTSHGSSCNLMANCTLRAEFPLGVPTRSCTRD